KPQNIMVNASGNIKPLDFGLSTRFTAGQKLNRFWCTLSCLDPKIVLMQAYEGPPVDIWNLSVILYFTLTGNRPFMGTTAKELLRQSMLASYHILHYVPVKAHRLIQNAMFLSRHEGL
ncbi:Sperm motility kinase 2B, partial [Sciurus carolinensis]|nr:Sperm motility kinase 2B [Sciurus carolinensis]